MDSKTKYMLLRTVQDNNILPITSVCNMSCRFCSHQGNPTGVEVYSFGHLKLELINELIQYISPEGPIIMGESSTKIIEGDPFTHPGFNKIINNIRRYWPDKLIKITTNGSYLTLDNVKFLDKLRPVELNVSLNCATPGERVFLMGDKKPEGVYRGLELLKEYKIPFNGSIVAMPHLLGENSIKMAVKKLALYNPDSVRIFYPGFTRYSPESIKFKKDIYSNLKEVVLELSNIFKFPIMLEPPFLEDFNCYIKGVIPESPAFKSSLKKGDIITGINGKTFLTRVECFNHLLREENPTLEIKRNNKIINTCITKKKGERPGIVVDYDIQPEVIDRLNSLFIKYKNSKIAVVTSLLGRKIIKKLLEIFIKNDPELDVEIITAENQFFGGSIMSAGLLVNEDVILSIKKREKKYDLLILPGIIYDIFGKDLTGKSYKKIAEELDCQVEII